MILLGFIAISNPCFLINSVLKLIYSKKTTKFCEIFTLLLTGTTWDKSKVKISQNFVAFSEYMNFTEKRKNVNLLSSHGFVVNTR